MDTMHDPAAACPCDAMPGDANPYFVLGTLDPSGSARKLIRAGMRRARIAFARDTHVHVRSLVVLSLCVAACLATHYGHKLGGERLLVPLFLAVIGVVVTARRGLPKRPGRLRNAGSTERFRRAASHCAASEEQRFGETPPIAHPDEPQHVSSCRDLMGLKRSLLSLVSKELRSPVAAIVSAARIITEHHCDKPDIVGRFGPAIASEGERVMRLLDECLDAMVMQARLQSAEREVHPSLVVDDVLRSMEEFAALRRIQLIEAIEADLPAVHMDPRRVAQVLATLVRNAIHATPSGGSVTVRAGLVDGALVFGIDDTGAGIPAHELIGVFDRGGLDLCISREIVRHYQGHIWAESEVGHGSTFAFSLPLPRTH